MVEVDVSTRCEHDCYYITLGSPAVWRLAGCVPFETEAEEWIVIHPTHDDCECF